jgi:hypothetical protein
MSENMTLKMFNKTFNAKRILLAVNFGGKLLERSRQLWIEQHINVHGGSK